MRKAFVQLLGLSTKDQKCRLGREYLIERFGEETVEELESLNCEQTSRMLDGTELTGYVEFRSSLYLGDDVRLDAYYYQDEDDVNREGDLAVLDWNIDHYAIEIV